ncbi:Putative TRIAD supradomain-containing protein [Septoria linicola]|uniref:TRIAD supradomain-containing protein n=1 Tax=Septoria linicola TaxID=215465 RepID=A0A9Q9B317_9PEZI|nr:Putative TRIAD supradomain-containing protein [Septoria linicola]
MATARRRSQPLVVDLTSDDEDEVLEVGPHLRASPDPAIDLEDDGHFPLFPGHQTVAGEFQGPFEQPLKEEAPLLGGNYQYFGEERVWVPDDSPQPPHAPEQQQIPVPFFEVLPDEPTFAPVAQVLTSDDCLQHVLDVFPDVSHEHVLKLYAELGEGDSAIPALDRYENIVNKLVEAESYPKQGRGKQAELKRKPEDDLKENDFKRWEGPEREMRERMLKGPIASALKADFPDIPRATIAKQITEHKYLFQTYVALAVMKDAKSSGWTGRASAGASADTIVINTGVPQLLEELKAARNRVSVVRAERTIELAKRQAEDDNLRRAINAGETAECQACFDDLPMNRQIHCNGEAAHFTCFDCAITYIKSEVGQSRCGVMCTAGCGAGYAHAQLHLLEDKALLAKLEQLQQEKDIRDAELDDLAECPFCDYKAILPPIEEDFEFRCANPDCEKISCRRCKAMSHIPASCEEHSKDHKLNSRHQIEEAMTAALVRKCGKCSKPFIKEFGCNKMSCPSCGNLQCYVCSASVKDYDHFVQNPAGGPRTGAGSSKKLCPLYDNVEERHEREIKEAEAKARAEAMEANPDITEDDLKIQESDAVRKATQDKIRRLGAANGAPLGILGGDYGLLDFGAGLDDDDFADLDDEEDDAPLQQIAAIQRGIRAGREAREGRLQREMQRLRERQRQLLRARRPPAAVGAGARVAQADNARGPLGHGLGGHIAGHGIQAHLAQPPRMYQGLAHPHPHQAPKLGMPNNMIGYMPIYGMQMPGVPRFPQRAPVVQPAPIAPQTNAAQHEDHAAQPDPFGRGYTLGGAQAAPAVPQPGDANIQGPGRVLGARNNGLGGRQGLFDAFAEDPFAGAEADPFGFGRIIQGEHAPPRFPEMLAPGQPRDHALGRNAQPGLRARIDGLALRAAREGQRRALQNMEDRAGGGGNVFELARDDPRRYHHVGGAWPGAPNAG